MILSLCNPDAIDETYGVSKVTPMNDESILSVCKPIGGQVLKVLPTITFNGRQTRPVMMFRFIMLFSKQT